MYSSAWSTVLYVLSSQYSTPYRPRRTAIPCMSKLLILRMAVVKEGGFHTLPSDIWQRTPRPVCTEYRVPRYSCHVHHFGQVTADPVRYSTIRHARQVPPAVHAAMPYIHIYILQYSYSMYPCTQYMYRDLRTPYSVCICIPVRLEVAFDSSVSF